MGIRNSIKKLAGRILQPASKRYLASPRSYRFKGLRLQIEPGVFHPGFFLSTKALIRHLEKENLGGKYFLELGAGSGLISLWAAQRGAHVTATDLNPIAVEALRRNVQKNEVQVEVLESDLFAKLKDRHFEWIIVNPPYYPKNPADEAELAWFCGENFEYFHKFFAQANDFLHPETQFRIILSEDCALEKIKKIAAEAGLKMNLVEQKRIAFEWNYIFELKKI